MSDTPEQTPPDDEPIDTGEPVAELAFLVPPISPGFFERVRRRIERRSMGNELVSFGWKMPGIVLLEFLAMVFQFLGFGTDEEGGSR